MARQSSLVHMLEHAANHLIPLSILFELTNRCNEDCHHCYVDLGDLEDELSTEEVQKILRELRSMGTLFLTFTGGEIFTRKDTLDLILFARKLGFALRLFTNGTRLTDEQIEAIAGCGVTGVEMSLYSMKAAEHDAVTRTKRSWEKTTRAARRMRARGIPVVLKAPVMSELGAAAGSVAAFAREIGADYRFDPVLLARYDLDDAPIERRMNRKELKGFCVDPHLGQAVGPEAEHVMDAGQPVCATARRVALISARGLVFPCTQRFPPCGDLRRQSFRQIWENAPLLMRLRNLTFGDLPVCAGCSQGSFCGRCSLDALFEDGDFFAPNSWRCDLAQLRRDAYAKGGTDERHLIEARLRAHTRGE